MDQDNPFADWSMDQFIRHQRFAELGHGDFKEPRYSQFKEAFNVKMKEVGATEYTAASKRVGWGR